MIFRTILTNLQPIFILDQKIKDYNEKRKIIKSCLFYFMFSIEKIKGIIGFGLLISMFFFLTPQWFAQDSSWTVNSILQTLNNSSWSTLTGTSFQEQSNSWTDVPTQTGNNINSAFSSWSNNYFQQYWKTLTGSVTTYLLWSNNTDEENRLRGFYILNLFYWNNLSKNWLFRIPEQQIPTFILIFLEFLFKALFLAEFITIIMFAVTMLSWHKTEHAYREVFQPKNQGHYVWRLARMKQLMWIFIIITLLLSWCLGSLYFWVFFDMFSWFLGDFWDAFRFATLWN